ncbi:MAG: DNA polymerase I [Nitrospinae bacterium]|nr:DNA polymerase I [Nitrospinota bacterium]
MSKKKTLYLIDGSSYIFRAFYGIRQNLSNSKGLPTNALYGFTTMLQKVVREEEPDYLAVVFDSKAKTFRHKIYPQYKANRDEPPEDLKAQFPHFEPLVEAYNIVSLRQDGYEADDIIGTLAVQGEKEGLEVVIVSGDKDMMQLIGPHVHMLDTMKNKKFGKKEVEEKFGVTPDKVIEVMGLMGDSSDNIPGVSGVGPKTAADLIQKFGSIKKLYEEIGSVDKVKLREKLERDKDNAFLSRELVILDTQMKLDRTIKDLQRKEPNKAELNKILAELEFTSLMHETEDESADEKVSALKSSYKTILDKKSFDTLIQDLKKAGEFALDLETTSKHPVHAAIVGISFSFKDNEACYIPLAHRYLGVPEQLDKKMALSKLKPLLEDPKLKKYGQNIKYDLIVFRNEGIRLEGIDFDTMLASYVLDPSRRGHSLDNLATEFLRRKTISYKEVAGTGLKEIGFDEVDVERATEYAAEDSDVTWLLMKKFRPKLKGETLALFREVEIPLIEVLAEMELAGVLLDVKHLAKLATSVEKDLKKLETQIYLIADEEFNINSPKQLAVILFEKLMLPAKKKTKTGYSTDVKVLEELSREHELPEKILSYRTLAKLKSTYIEALPQEIYNKTGRIHTSFNQTVAATGRLSSSGPNLQNIPIRTELGREIRKAFIAEGDCQLLSADYSQIELRILAHLSGDKALIKAFEKGDDIHSRTAAEIFGQPLNDVDAENRRMAKAVNFGIVYGLSAFGLSRQLKIAVGEAKNFIEQYFKLYKMVKVFMDETIESAGKLGYTTTMLKRRRYLPDINSKNRQEREAAERIAINSPVQGSAADLIKVAMIHLHHGFKKKKLKSKMILQVHDELVFECPPDERKTVEKMVKKEMEGVFKLKVPLIVSMAWGKNWNDAH